MCGFPVAHLDKYLKILVQEEQRSVAMCEEFPIQTIPAVKEFSRRIARIITPGTLIDESFLDTSRNNFLLAVTHKNYAVVEGMSHDVLMRQAIGLSWIDISTAEYFSKESTCEALLDDLARISPREVVLDACISSFKAHPIFKALSEMEAITVSYTTPLPTSTKSSIATQRCADCYCSIAPLNNHSAAFSLEEISAISLLNTFLQETLLENMPVLPAPTRDKSVDHMKMDIHTIKALEIQENMQDGKKKGSLLNVIKRTVTQGGTRLLSRWLCQ